MHSVRVLIVVVLVLISKIVSVLVQGVKIVVVPLIIPRVKEKDYGIVMETLLQIILFVFREKRTLAEDGRTVLVVPFLITPVVLEHGNRVIVLTFPTILFAWEDMQSPVTM